MGAADGMFLGDLQRRVAKLESLVTMLTSGRRMESASIGAGGTRYHSGGSSTYEGGGGTYIRDGGQQFVQGGKITAADPDGELVFEVDAGDSPSIFMRQELIQALSIAIFADRIHTNVVESIAERTSETYGNPTTGSAGPTCAGVEISESGKALVLIGGLMRSATGTSVASEETGHMSVAISGASSVPASDVNSAYLHATMIDSAAIQATQTIVSANVARVVLFDGLNAGTHTFTAQYRRGPAHDKVFVYNRSLVVFAF